MFEELGGMDIYLIDQFMKGNIRRDMRVLDAGAGGGRNIVWMLRHGFDVCACEANGDRAEHLKTLFAVNAPDLPSTNVRAEAIEDLSFQSGSFDVVIANAVLHFAQDDDHWDAMVDRLWAMLAPNGMLFTRLATNIGIEDYVRRELHGWYYLPDGSRRYLVDQKRLETKRILLGGELMEPIKSTNVQNLRTMTTWVLRKR
ncbi:MAG: class I SAM-dependent methyltransferase [Planctomycetes bacterium]|nr:class I SAM-dependent methyltransferase [Planctomycetota bacterium]